jgi:acetyl esterase/lipase
MKKLSLVALLSVCLLSCIKEVDPVSAPTLPEKTELNVAYGFHAAQKLDLYLPAGRTNNTKAIIVIHGGGWSTGDKSDLTPYIDTLKKRLPGYAIFNLNYRLATGTSDLFPTQENDVKAAVDFIYGKKNDYVISDKWAMLGVSAGAHLSLLHAYKYTVPVKIKAVVDFFGPADLIDMYNNPASIFAPPSALAAVTGGTPGTHLSLYQQSSPVTFINAQTSPTIILQGGLDPLVSVNQATTLKNLLQTNGVTHQYIFYPTEGHGWSGANLTDSFDKIGLFLTATVN